MSSQEQVFQIFNEDGTKLLALKIKEADKNTYRWEFVSEKLPLNRLPLYLSWKYQSSIPYLIITENEEMSEKLSNKGIPTVSTYGTWNIPHTSTFTTFLNKVKPKTIFIYQVSDSSSQVWFKKLVEVLSKATQNSLIVPLTTNELENLNTKEIESLLQNTKTQFLSENKTYLQEIKTLKEKKWIWKSFIGEGDLCYIISEPKSGKSLLALNLAYFFLQKKDFSNFPITQKEHSYGVLYIASENKPLILSRALTMNMPEKFYTSLAIPLTYQNLPQIYHIAKNLNIKLIIIDTLKDFILKNSTNRSLQKELPKIISTLNTLTKQYHITTILLDNKSKNSTFLHHIDIIIATKTKGKKLIIKTLSNTTENLKLTTELTPTLTLNFNPLPEVKLCQNLILQALKQNKQLKTKDLLQIIKLQIPKTNPKTLRKLTERAIKTLITKNLIHQPTKGIYKITE